MMCYPLLPILRRVICVIKQFGYLMTKWLKVLISKKNSNLAYSLFQTRSWSILYVPYILFPCPDSVWLRSSCTCYFRLEDAKVQATVCNVSVDQALLQGASGSAQFYVFVGVMVFLYCLAALIMYIFFDQTYRKHNACTYGVGSYYFYMLLWLCYVV